MKGMQVLSSTQERQVPQCVQDAEKIRRPPRRREGGWWSRCPGDDLSTISLISRPGPASDMRWPGLEVFLTRRAL
jgi:hypothetical protein